MGKHFQVPRLSTGRKTSPKTKAFLSDVLAYAEENGLELTGLVVEKKTGAVMMFSPTLCMKHVDCGPLYLLKVIHEMQHHAEGAIVRSKKKSHPRKKRTT